MNEVQIHRPVVLCILDGFGIGDGGVFDAVAQANTSVWDGIKSTCPGSTLVTYGEDVGLPEGQMGNSEVGHMNIGAGRIVNQLLTRINKAFKNGDVADNLALQKLIGKLKKTGGTCHLMGLVSDGGVHAHIDHISALAEIVAREGVSVVIHAFTDGRDTPPQSGKEFILSLSKSIEHIDIAQIATVSGRYYAMDRDKRWERIEKAYSALLDGNSSRHFNDVSESITVSYDEGVTDEFIVPSVIGDYEGMKDGDGLLCANFRSDRVREILTALFDKSFDGFDRSRIVDFCQAVSMVDYSDELAEFMDDMFPPQKQMNILGELVSRAGLKQLRAAETEKYPHVTYFFNNGREKPYEGEDRILVPSPKVATYDLQPEMSAQELTDKLCKAIDSDQYDFVVVNYANPDMVGHTGDLQAVVKAVETVDIMLGRLKEIVLEKGGVLLVTADHGNADKMWDDTTNGPHTAHTMNPVPFYVVNGPKGIRVRQGILADIAPTVLALLELDQPSEMTGKSLLVK